MFGFLGLLFEEILFWLAHWRFGSNNFDIIKSIFDVFDILDQERSYDRIYVDLIDPSSTASWWLDLFRTVVSWLTPTGSVCINAGGIFPWDDGHVPAIENILKSQVEGKCKYQITRHKKWIPSFGREWAFVILKKY
jgi:predicted membrane-bound spermidine synthase